jgi:uncharacterized protein YyaL (SSP411 family)
MKPVPIYCNTHNPVNWYPWGEKHFKKKRRKILIISIGLPLVTGVM